MKLKTILASLAICAVCVLGLLFAGSKPVDAATKQIVFDPGATATGDAYGSLYIGISSPIKAESVKKLEYQYGKVTKTSNKKWKNATPLPVYNDDDGTTISYVYVYGNGTYSVRLTTTSGKKYVKTIKVKNIVPVSQNSSKEAIITDISAPDKDGNVTITVDYLTPYNKNYEELVGTKVGDTLDFGGKKATIVSMYELDDSYDLVPITSFTDECKGIICKANNWKEFFSSDEDYRENPQNQMFGLISFDGGLYIAYDDYDYAPDCYVKLSYVYPSGVKLKVTKDTVVIPAYVDHIKNPDGVQLSISEYVALKADKELQDEMGVYINDSITYEIYEKYSKKKGTHTDVVDIIHEIYTP